MSEWKTVPINTFLKERKNRFRPSEANELNQKRLYKIDFSGNIHILEDKTTNTNMILVKKGDLVISGINVEKGAVAVYEGKEDILATIHYSSYEFDKSKIDIGYFKWFLKSKQFKDIVNSQIRGGIKTELKPKKFLPLEIPLPDLPTQIKIRDKIENVVNEITELRNLDESNEEFTDKLRQSILQEAVSGKLVPQDPADEPAKEHIKKLIKERLYSYSEGIKRAKTDNKRKPQKPKNIQFWGKNKEVIFEDENVPRNWAKTYFINLCVLQRGFDLPKTQFKEGKYPVASSGGIMGYHNEYKAKGPGVFTGRSGSVGKVYYIESDFWPHNTSLFVKDFNNNYPKYVYYALKAYGVESESSSTAVATLNRNRLFKMKIVLPPYEEQIRIVNKIEQLMQLCDELEEQVKENQKNSELLMDAVLKEAFAAN